MGNLYLIIGKDDFLVTEAAKKIFAGKSGLEIIDSLNSTNEELQLKDIAQAKESFLTPPFFDPEKVTYWRNVRFLTGGKGEDGEEGKEGKEKGEERAPSAAVKAALEDFATTLASMSLPENQYFIISAPSLLMTSKFAKALSQVAEFIVFETPKGQQAARQAVVRAIDRAKGLGLEFAPGAADLFVTIVGDDTRSIYNELEKLVVLKLGQSKVIKQEEINSITSPGAGVEPVVWQVTDAINKRDLAKAVSKIREFEGDSGFSVMMTIVLERCFRQLVEAKSAKEAGTWDEFAKNLNPWAAKNLEMDLANWTLLELRTARKRMMDLREKVVTSSSLDPSAITIEVVRALRGARSARGRARR